MTWLSSRALFAWPQDALGRGRTARSGFKGAFEQVVDGLFSLLTQVPGSGPGEGLVLDGRRAFHPAAIFPVEPAVAVLVEDADGPVEEFGKLHGPAGPPFYGVVWLGSSPPRTPGSLY